MTALDPEFNSFTRLENMVQVILPNSEEKVGLTALKYNHKVRLNCLLEWFNKKTMTALDPEFKNILGSTASLG